MTITKENKNSISEVLDILKHMDEEEINKIPFDIIKRLNENKDENYISNIDYAKPLEESEISKSALEILAYIYKEYLCLEEEKKEYDKILYNNDIKYEEQLKEKFNSNDLFKEKNVNENSNLPSVIKNDSFFRKIIDKIKQLLKIKK